jgi:hypothetical protein
MGRDGREAGDERAAADVSEFLGEGPRVFGVGHGEVAVGRRTGMMLGSCDEWIVMVILQMWLDRGQVGAYEVGRRICRSCPIVNSIFLLKTRKGSEDLAYQNRLPLALSQRYVMKKEL